MKSTKKQIVIYEELKHKLLEVKRFLRDGCMAMAVSMINDIVEEIISLEEEE